MFKKLKDGVMNFAQNQADAQMAQEARVKELFAENVENANDYIIGVAQEETETGGALAAATQIIGNTVMLDWKDYIIGVKNGQREIVALMIENDTVIDKIEFTGDFKIKKDTLLGNELKNTMKQMFNVRARQSGDRYGRDTFTVEYGDIKIDFLVGSYMNEGTNYPYNNEALTEALKNLK